MTIDEQTPAVTIDPEKLMAFVFRAVDEVGAALNAALVVMGDQLGYYRALAEARGAAFLDAGAVIEVSPQDGIHFEAESHRRLGTAVAEVCRKMGVSEATFFRPKQKFGGLGPSELRKLRQLEEENTKLKRLVADLSLDKSMLQEVLAKKP